MQRDLAGFKQVELLVLKRM